MSGHLREGGPTDPTTRIAMHDPFTGKTLFDNGFPLFSKY